ncbi:MAG: DNA repair protein RecO [Bacteroidia bacterium]
MLTKTKAIVIKTIDYSENSVILKCFTEQYGLQSYLINGVKNKKGAIKPSHLLPLNLLDLDVYHQLNKNLQRIKELKCQPILNNIHYDLLKSSIGIFMGEVLNKTIQAENQADKNLFEFLFTVIQYLDLTQQSLANFPVYFMLQLSQYLGFNPKLNYSEINNSFDLEEGIFKATLFGDIKVVESHLAEYWFDLCKVNFDSFSQIEINKTHRNELLNHVMLYYKIHIDGFNELKSNKVLVEVLS